MTDNTEWEFLIRRVGGGDSPLRDFSSGNVPVVQLYIVWEQPIQERDREN